MQTLLCHVCEAKEKRAEHTKWSHAQACTLLHAGDFLDTIREQVNATEHPYERAED
jgi:hypothetical protein